MLQGMFLELRKDRPNSKGELPIRIRYQKLYKSTKVSVHPDYWTGERVKKSHSKSVFYNKKIEEEIRKFEKEIIEGPEKSLQDITIRDYVEAKIKQWAVKKQRAPETIRQYHSELNKLNGFKPGLTLKKLDHALFNQYWEYLVNIGNVENTIWKSFKFVKMVVNMAIEERVLRDNPLIGFEKPKYLQKSRTYLTPDLVRRIAGYANEGDEPTHRCARLFLFACYTGFRYSDIQVIISTGKLPLSNGRLIVTTQKTGEPVGIKLTPTIEALLKQCIKDKFVVTNTHANRILHIVEQIKELNLPPISFHIARHTFAMRLMEVGVSVETIQTLLGHRNIRTTQIYAKIGNSRIDEEMEKFKY